MWKISRLIKISGFVLVTSVLISFVFHFIFAFRDYKQGKLFVAVEDRVSVEKDSVINSMKFKNFNFGCIEIKPTFEQAIILENEIFKDSGATAFFYLLSGIFLLVISNKSQNLLGEITQKNIYNYIASGILLYISCQFAFAIFLRFYVKGITHNTFTYYDRGCFSNLTLLGLLILGNAVFQLLIQVSKLQEENDLTI
ncbi:hypothetical protein [Pedobacter sp. KBS0701]|uniref:hypothetical protein n=1 Tax=unclassified Pedobacter TaxID=2628915 RepID=UPI00110E41FD|nr:hypothetical protein [Pedobacter sp. KBS0701]QDW24071.1 hypothetical protein FFJ24_004220 [Pedobacter sp. KBS0701]